MEKFKTILLDLGGVVFDIDPNKPQSVDWDVIHLLNQKYGDEMNLGQDRFPAFLKKYNEKSQSRLSEQSFFAALYSGLSYNEELLLAFREHSYQIIVVSDNYKENIEALFKSFPLADFISGSVYSFELAVSKQNPLFFQTVLEKFKLVPNQCLLIDDHIQIIESAKQLGIPGHLYKDNDKVFEVLQTI